MSCYKAWHFFILETKNSLPEYNKTILNLSKGLIACLSGKTQHTLFLEEH